MHNAATCTHALHLAIVEHIAVTHRVFIGELAFHHHSDDFHASVGVHAKPHPIWVVVMRKAEAVPAVEPVQLAVVALGGWTETANGMGRCRCHSLYVFNSSGCICNSRCSKSWMDSSLAGLAKLLSN